MNSCDSQQYYFFKNNIFLEKKMECTDYIKIQVSTVYQAKMYGTIGDLKIMI